MNNKPQDSEHPSIEALIAAKERAEAANRAKSEFLGIVSHELRLPLTGILGMAHMLHLEYLLPVQREQVEDIIQSSEHLLALVDDLLDVAKLDAGKMELSLVPLDLRKLLEETATMLTFQTSSKGLELLVSYDEGTPHRIVGDARALRQIVLNLVGNALKFTEQGYISIRVKCLSQTDTTAQLMISIEDTGVGIAEDKLQEIFESFKQDDIDYKRRYSGAGLGLTISRAYIELMGGKLEVQSQLGRGSIFSCIIPFELQATATLASPWEAYKDDVRTLIVDDTLRGEVLARHIASPNVQVVTGKEAIATLITAERCSAPYDVVIIDQQLSSINALDLGQAINTQFNACRPLLMLLMSQDTAMTKDAAKAAGFFETLIKPVQPTELQMCLTVAWEAWGEQAGIRPKKDVKQSIVHPIRILLVEDDRIIQKVHKKMLEQFGCQVELAENGLDALNKFKQASYDLVFMDVGLPKMSGIEVAAAIRKHEGNDKYTPIVALTGFSQEEDKANCLAAGMDAVATKPITPDLLKRFLQQWISK